MVLFLEPRGAGSPALGVQNWSMSSCSFRLSAGAVNPHKQRGQGTNRVTRYLPSEVWTNRVPVQINRLNKCGSLSGRRKTYRVWGTNPQAEYRCDLQRLQVTWWHFRHKVPEQKSDSCQDWRLWVCAEQLSHWVRRFPTRHTLTGLNRTNVLLASQ